MKLLKQLLSIYSKDKSEEIKFLRLSFFVGVYKKLDKYHELKCYCVTMDFNILK